MWPDVERKSNPNFETIAQKVAIKAFNKKVMFFIIAQKALNIWATFVRKFAAKKF